MTNYRQLMVDFLDCELNGAEFIASQPKELREMAEEAVLRLQEIAAQRTLPQFVYAVGAVNTDTDRVTDVQVHRDLKRAQHVFSELKAVYGGANVFMASCEVDSVKMGAPTKLSDLTQG